MWCRLSTVAVDLVELLQAQRPARLRRAAADVARLAVQRTQLVDLRIDSALAALHDGNFGDSDAHSAVQQLTKELDMNAWELQRVAEENGSSMQPYYAAFARARAAASVKCALYSDSLSAALEAVYEAQAAVEDLEAVRISIDISLAD
jgi:hypothetical protein